MKTIALVAVLAVAASPAKAQFATANGQPQSAIQNSQPAPPQAPTTGVFCIEEMTATFCNVVRGPNNSGYGARSGVTSSNASASRGGSASTGGSIGGPGSASGARGPSSIPPCAAEPPFNELCD
jgi:hypothetical protein